MVNTHTQITPEIKQLFDKVSTPESEAYVLAYLTSVINPEVSLAGALLMNSFLKLFNVKLHRKVAACIQLANRQNQKAVYEFVLRELCIKPEKQNRIFISDLSFLNMPVHQQNFEYHLRVCYESMMRRFTIYQSEMMKQRALDLENDVFEEVNKISELVAEYQKRIPVKPRSLQALVGDSFDELIQRQKRYLEGAKGMRFGLKQLDSVIYELPEGGLTVVAARPGHGKTSLMLQYIVNQCQAGYRTLVHSLEMTEQQIVDGLICYLAGFDRTYFTRGMVALNQGDEQDRLYRAMETIQSWPLVIKYFGTEKHPPFFETVIADIRGNCDTAQSEGDPIQAVATDYFQLLKPSPGNTYQTRDLFRMASSQFMVLAKEYGYNHLLLSQLNRGAAGQPPKAHHMAESDQLERDATQVLLLFRPEKDGIETFSIQGVEQSSKDICLINISKNRLQGTEGIVSQTFIQGRFINEHETIKEAF